MSAAPVADTTTEAEERWRSLAVVAVLGALIALAVFVPSSLLHRHGKGAATPVRRTAPHVTPRPVPLRGGRESMFVSLDVGDLATARGLLQNLWPERGYPSPQLAWPLTWTENPHDDAYFRFQFYGLQPTANLLWAYERTHDVRFRNRLVAILRSYIAYDRTRPYDRLTFDNPHAAAFRAMALVNAYVKLGRRHELPADLQASIPQALQKLGGFLAYRHHAFESWVNHGFNEAAALLLIADNLPTLPRAMEWRQLGLKRLQRMLVLDVDADGVDVENSPYYHYYVLGIVSQIAAWARANEPSLAAPYGATEKRMLHYAAALTLPDGHLPMLGATAQTRVPALDPDVYASLAALDPAFAYAYSDGRQGTAPAAGTTLFGSAGLFVLRSNRTAERLGQAVATFDAGAYRTEHSDLDALSLTLFAGGQEVLPDSGLYTYLDGASRRYFHGTRAHNTVVVDGADQQAGDAAAGASGSTASGGWAQGESRLYAGVTHQRTLVVLNAGLTLVVDRLRSAEQHDYAQIWHLAPGASTRGSVTDVTAADAYNRPLLQVVQAHTAGVTMTRIEGQHQPMQGWISLAYGEKQPAPALEYHARGTEATFVTLLAAGSEATARLLVREEPAGDGTRVVICGAHAQRSVVVPAEASASQPIIESEGSC